MTEKPLSAPLEDPDPPPGKAVPGPAEQPPVLNRRQAFQGWGRGLGRFALDLFHLEDPEARLQRERERILYQPATANRMLAALRGVLRLPPGPPSVSVD